MDRVIEAVLTVAFIAAILAAIFSVGPMLYTDGYDMGYRKGQIDALTGEVRYELQEQENGEMLWEDIEP